MIDCTLQHFNRCKEVAVKLESRCCYVHVVKSVETIHEGKVVRLWKGRIDSAILKLNRTSQSVIKRGKCMLIDDAML